MSVARSAFSSLLTVIVSCVSFVAGLVAGLIAWMSAAHSVQGDLFEKLSDVNGLVVGLGTMLAVTLIVATLLNRLRTFVASRNVQR